MMRRLQKRAAAKRNITVRFANLPDGVTIASATWAFVPSSGAPVIASETINGADVIGRCTGGTVDVRYRVTCLAIWSDGQEEPAEFELLIT